MRIATDKKNMQGRMSDTDKVLLLLCGIKHKISARQDYYVSFMRYGEGGGKELLHCFEISETTGKAFIVKLLVYSYVLLPYFPLSLDADSHFCDIDDNSSYSPAM